MGETNAGTVMFLKHLQPTSSKETTNFNCKCIVYINLSNPFIQFFKTLRLMNPNR